MCPRRRRILVFFAFTSGARTGVSKDGCSRCIHSYVSDLSREMLLSIYVNNGGARRLGRLYIFLAPDRFNRFAIPVWWCHTIMSPGGPLPAVNGGALCTGRLVGRGGYS